MQVCKPGSVPTKWWVLIIYLLLLLLTVCSCLPSEIGPAALKLLYIWHCNTMGLLLKYVAILKRELLPHVFTFVPIISE